MAEPEKVFITGNTMRLIMDDGSQYVANPTPSQVWVFTGGSGGGTDPDPGGSSGFRVPFSWDAVTSEYGPRSGGAGSFHEGTDFGAGLVGGPGTPIITVAGGVVEAEYYHRNFGNMIIVNHGVFSVGPYAGMRLRTLYAHMENPALFEQGQIVPKDAVLGGVGNTGGSFGAHLHLEVHVSGPNSGIVWNTSNNGNYRTAVNARDFFAAYGG